MSVTVLLKGLTIVAATATFPSPTVTSDGIHPVPASIMDTIYICWSLLIPKVTFLFFPC